MGPLELYHYLNTEIADTRTNHWFLISSPVSIILLSLAYLYFVLKCGPRYMKDRNPYKLHQFIRLYNVFQIVTNVWFVYEAIDAGWYRDYFFYCRPVEYSSAQAIRFTYLAWYLLLLKLFDYIETCIFVLRKKYRQVSFLHLYHHVSTVFIVWTLVKYFCTGIALTIALVNSMVHVIMYTYYLLSSFGPSVRQLLNPIKKMITIIQMIQFVFLMLHSMRAYIPGCPGVKFGATVVLIDLAINLVLFYDFYQKNYVEKNKQK